MLKTMKNAFAVKEIRQKILFTLGVLIVFRLGTYITVPGINAKLLLKSLFNCCKWTLFRDLLN